MIVVLTDRFRIGIDGRNIGRPNGTGVANYASTLARTCGDRRWRSVRVIDAPAAATTRSTHSPTAKVRRFLSAVRQSAIAKPVMFDGEMAWLAPDVFRIAQVHFNIRRRLLTVTLPDPPAVMHWTYPLPLHVAGVANVVTVHDLIPLLEPDLTDICAIRMERMLRATTSRAAYVVTVSETVRADIIRRLGVPAEKVVNLYQAVDLPPEATDAPLPCPAGSFVYVGSIERRKNIARLIAAHGRSGSLRMLVLIGPDGDHAATELAALSLHPNPDRVLRLPWIGRPSLVQAIRCARALVFPSLAEGFGLPIAEAMTLGTPVLTSRGGATEEIAGGAALLADPRDVGELADAVARLDRDDELCARLGAAGRARAGLFSIEAYGERLDRLYHQVLAGSLPMPVGIN
ncbi:glycosyltransferase family 4 protein [Lichenicola cladoniae]|uniref:Glycosyltransferase family 4 protein n=1 Tax=Lichenicola cladoniae TaxID=1484109 RepID=A0A6M8HNY6_9PROT|nr:glycosyltransferase family 1 protein [Lichenicola cladoniae]NPD68340.1 glycosyltransferase family 4 protein [Acetobacteraceae bacterium]QKE90159.1 glycosyltransferase family 4 protein [Lichenicola cladoniae]